MRREKETDGLRFERVKSLFLSWLLDLDLDLCNLFFSINVPIYTHKIILLYYEILYIFSTEGCGNASLQCRVYRI